MRPSHEVSRPLRLTIPIFVIKILVILAPFEIDRPDVIECLLLREYACLVTLVKEIGVLHPRHLWRYLIGTVRDHVRRVVPHKTGAVGKGYGCKYQ